MQKLPFWTFKDHHHVRIKKIVFFLVLHLFTKQTENFYENILPKDVNYIFFLLILSDEPHIVLVFSNKQLLHMGIRSSHRSSTGGWLWARGRLLALVWVPEERRSRRQKRPRQQRRQTRNKSKQDYIIKCSDYGRNSINKKSFWL